MIVNAKLIGKGIDPSAYHKQEAQRGTPGFAMSASSIKESLRCLRRWVRGYEPPRNDGMKWGLLLDTVVLSHDALKTRYAVRPAAYPDAKTGEAKDWNGNSNWCRAWLADQEAKGLSVVTLAELNEAEEARKILLDDEVLGPWNDASDTQVLVTAEWKDEVSGLKVPLQCLIDYVPRIGTEFEKSLGDLKTVSSAQPDTFCNAVYRYGWHIQAAFDMDMYTAATGEDRCNWCFVLSENYKPWEVGRELLSQDYLDLGRAAYKYALAKYVHGLSKCLWTGYDDGPNAVQGWTLCIPKPWMAFAEQERELEARYEQERAAYESNDVPV
jgi:hypothetical protein